MTVRAPNSPGSLGVKQEGGESLLRRFSRRVSSVVGVHLALILLVGSAPLWLPLLAAVGLFQKNSFPLLRCFLYLTWLMACDSAGLIGALGIALGGRRNREIWLARNYALQSFWTGALYAGARRLLGIRLEVRGSEVLAQGRVIILLRHASVVDALLPDLVAARPYGLRLRYVLKRELRIDPCLDIVGDRLPNAFVLRGAPDGGPEIARVRGLAENLGPEDGVVLFPEGTRFTPSRRARILAGLAERGETERHAVAAELNKVLPPRLGGAFALMEVDPEADVVFCAHTGTEALTRLGDLLSGSALGARLQVECWRVPASEIPREEYARKAWLDAQWARVDDWVVAHGG